MVDNRDRLANVSENKAIALPSFLNQALRARQSEAQTYTGSVNRAQQAYYLQHSAFAAGLTDLELGIPNSTEYYTYRVGTVNADSALFNANPKTNTRLRGYSGLVWLGQAGGSATTLAKVCEGPANGSGNVPCTPDG